jgi:hypothetical protein
MATFNQWWYLMITDLETNDTWSLGIGGFRSGRRGAPGHAGGWLKVKRGGSGPAASLPRFTVPFELLEADDTLNVRVWRNGADAAAHDPDVAALRIDVLDASTLRIRAALGSPLPPDANGKVDYSSGADITLTRVHGVIGSDASAAEECRIANVPFAYASTATGRLWISAGNQSSGSLDDSAKDSGSAAAVTLEPTSGPRFRAYLETTWGCTFPSPPLGGDPLRYPWKWMWAVVPGAAGVGDLGVLVNNARLSVPLAGSVLPSVAMDVQGTFAFIDLPGGVRIAAVNVTLFDGAALPVPLVLSTPQPHDLLEVSSREVHRHFSHASCCHMFPVSAGPSQPR